MPIRQIQERSEQHLVIKPHLHNSMKPVQKPPKTTQNGKGPPAQEPQDFKLDNRTSNASKNRGKRRGRGGRKSDHGDAIMRPSSEPCNPADKILLAQPPAAVEADIPNGGNLCKMEARFPSSSKSLSFAPRPGYGQLGARCIVKANHFFTQLPDKDLNQYDVS